MEPKKSKMLTSEQVFLAVEVGKLSEENQRIYFKMLGDVLSEDEIKSFQIVVAYFRMKSNPYREKAIKTALAEQLYAEFNRR